MHAFADTRTAPYPDLVLRWSFLSLGLDVASGVQHRKPRAVGTLGGMCRSFGGRRAEHPAAGGRAGRRAASAELDRDPAPWRIGHERVEQFEHVVIDKSARVASMITAAPSGICRRYA